MPYIIFVLLPFALLDVVPRIELILLVSPCSQYFFKLPKCVLQDVVPRIELMLLVSPFMHLCSMRTEGIQKCFGSSFDAIIL